MNTQNSALPFGLLFEEAASNPPNNIMPIYDEETDISYVQDDKGNLIPYVESKASMGTDTVTETRQETTDADPENENDFSASSIYLMGTDTGTKTHNEATDSD